MRQVLTVLAEALLQHLTGGRAQFGFPVVDFGQQPVDLGRVLAEHRPARQAGGLLGQQAATAGLAPARDLGGIARAGALFDGTARPLGVLLIVLSVFGLLSFIVGRRIAAANSTLAAGE